MKNVEYIEYLRKYKVTDTHCFDGGKHKWKFLCVGGRTFTASLETRWCMKCGSLTEYVTSGNRKVRMQKSETGEKYFIDKPFFFEE